ncbi:MAG TPA: hypothetical protein VIL18_07285 [Longimicrobiales bacterium]
MSRRGFLAATVAALIVPASAVAQENWSSKVVKRAYAGEARLMVEVEYGAGQLRVNPASAADLYRAAFRYDPDAIEPVTSYADGRLKISATSGAKKLRGISNGGQLDLALGRSVPVHLKLSYGAAEADLELGGLRLREARIETGASSTNLRFSEPNPETCEYLEIHAGAASFNAYGLGNSRAKQVRLEGGVGHVVLDLTGDWAGDMRVSVEMGLGSLTVRVPRTVGVRLQKTSIFAGVTSPGFSKRDDAYYSDNWGSARHRLTLDVEAAFGNVDIRWVD